MLSSDPSPRFVPAPPLAPISLVIVALVSPEPPLVMLPLADAAAPHCFRSFGQFIRRIGHSRRTPALYLTSTAKYRVCGGAVVIGDQRTAVDLGPAARLQFEPLTRNRHGHLPVLLLFRETDPQLGKC